jgi:hypothetical protein
MIRGPCTEASPDGAGPGGDNGGESLCRAWPTTLRWAPKSSLIRAFVGGGRRWRCLRQPCSIGNDFRDPGLYAAMAHKRLPEGFVFWFFGNHFFEFGDELPVLGHELAAPVPLRLLLLGHGPVDVDQPGVHVDNDIIGVRDRIRLGYPPAQRQQCFSGGGSPVKGRGKRN